MATLSTTLGTAKSPSSAYNKYGSGAGGYGSITRQNPYTNYGANVGSQSNAANQNLYASLAMGQQQQQALPSTQFQAQYSFDPVLARLSQLGQMTVANARSEAAALKKQALIESGATDVAQGVGAEANTVEAARQNPTSTAALLKRDFQERQRQLDEGLNQQNLFYSGERANRMGELEFGRAQAESDWLTKLKQLLTGIDSEQLAAEEAAQQREIDAASSLPVALGLGGADTGVTTVPDAGGEGPAVPTVPGVTPLPGYDITPPEITLADLNAFNSSLMNPQLLTSPLGNPLNTGGYIDPLAYALRGPR